MSIMNVLASTRRAMVAGGLVGAPMLATVTLDAAGASMRRHELPNNRATLVVRDGTHLSVTLYLNYIDVLHRMLAPRRTVGEFLVMYSSVKPAVFRAELERAQNKLQSSIDVGEAGAGPERKIALTGWKWPSAAEVQASIQQAAMQAVVAPDDHITEVQTEIQAEALAPRAIESLRVRFPPELSRVLVVSYRPNQVWAEPREAGTVVRF